MEKIRGFEIVPDNNREYPDADIILPARGTKHSACYDIYSPVSLTIPPHAIGHLATDVRAYMQDDEVLMIYPRSSMGKVPMMLANTTGVVDADYYDNESNGGNILVKLHNLSSREYEIKAGDRIAQAMFVNYLVADNGNTDTVRTGGVGSTGV